ncbi:S-adenosylmethionine decarboxylase proenzyme isoform X1 [Cryptomeria japonica]|uniref:S-adenosylmethionine decarboxylase proenzyme isoform X1 n=1 Tax=Cryptomeria japonica TaxID=3369 RepID=UPI0025ACCFE8|nr:S-adenosylmethionine decarboxylase proenzyme isoform X1 [Cryptomeria japonica]
MVVSCGQYVTPTMYAIGFEGFEKRLEIEFFATPFFADPGGRGLRALTRPQLDEILKPAECTIVSELSNEHLDSYVLSESSMFIYPFKIALKTCGTSKLLLSIPKILSNASGLSLSVKAVKYTRGTFFFNGAQSFPHRSFAEEISYLEKYFGMLGSGGKAYVMGDPDKNYKWHVYSACADDGASNESSDPVFTLEMCMTELDRERASLFNKSNIKSAGEMTLNSGIRDILPGSDICDFEFDPCGYSMNAIERDAVSTIHVTPEDGFSYASFEAVGYGPQDVELKQLVERVLFCFKPEVFSIALHVSAPVGQSSWTVFDKPPQGYFCDMTSGVELTGSSNMVYMTYRSSAKESHRTTLPLLAWEEESLFTSEKKQNWDASEPSPKTTLSLHSWEEESDGSDG